MNKGQKITIGVALLVMFAFSVIDNSALNSTSDYVREFMPIILLAGAVFVFFSLKKKP